MFSAARKWFALLIFMTVFAAGAQDFCYRIGANAHYGFLWPHRSIMQHLVTGHARVFEFQVEKQTLGEQPWENSYHRPSYGWNLRVFDLSNPGQIGLAIGSSVYTKLPLCQSKRLRWDMELGWGPGMVTKPFDVKENSQNIAIGSYFNAFLMLGTGLELKVSERMAAVANVSFNHFSNGALRMPNLGINIPVAGVGLTYAFDAVDSVFRTDTPMARQPSFWAFSLAAGMKEISPGSGPYPSLISTFERNIGLSRKSSIAPGIDIFYNSALPEIRRRNGRQLKSEWANFQIGASIMYNLHIGRVAVLMGLGAYLFDEYGKDGRLYNRIGMRYSATENFKVNIALKTHKFKADYPEVGFSYAF